MHRFSIVLLSCYNNTILTTQAPLTALSKESNQPSVVCAKFNLPALNALVLQSSLLHQVRGYVRMTPYSQVCVYTAASTILM